MFKQTWILWCLPLALLPLAIHLLNRLRYRRMDWAAMPFLFKAANHSTRQERLKHILILLCRMMAVIMLILALSQPITGGWLGLSFSGPPRTVVLLLDRSASMEERVPGSADSKRQAGLQRVRNALTNAAPDAELIVIDSVSENAVPADPEGLPGLPNTQSSDGSADMPRMFSAALDWFMSNPGGRADISIVSDLQKENWAPESEKWEGIAEQYRQIMHHRDIRFRLLDMGMADRNDPDLIVQRVTPFTVKGKSFLDISCRLRGGAQINQSVPMRIELMGKPVAEMQVTPSESGEFVRKLVPFESRDAIIWGSVSLAKESSSSGDIGYFAAESNQTAAVGIFSSDRNVRRIFALAASAGNSNSHVMPSSPTAVGQLDLNNFSLIIWHGSMTADHVESLRDYMETGGCVLMFPDETPVKNQLISWGRPERLSGKELKVEHWDRQKGLLMDGVDGQALPVEQLITNLRILPDIDGDSLALYDDGTPLIISHGVGQGSFTVCSTSPSPEWSSLADGPILVPMVQRLNRDASQRFSKARTLHVGDVNEAELRDWIPLDAGEGATVQAASGVYKAEDHILALNKPEVEYSSVQCQTTELKNIFSGIPFNTFSESEAGGNRAAPAEAWRLFFYAMLILVVAELWLTRPGMQAGGGA